MRLYAILQRDRFDDRQGELTGLVQATDDHTRVFSHCFSNRLGETGRSVPSSCVNKCTRYSSSIQRKWASSGSA